GISRTRRWYCRAGSDCSRRVTRRCTRGRIRPASPPPGLPLLLLMAVLSGPACQKDQMTNSAFTDARSAQLADAAAGGDAALVRSQLQQGADPDARGEDGLNLLQHAIISGSRDGLGALLAGRGAPTLHGYSGATALHTA